MAKKVIVGGRIESKEVGGIVTGAAEILDDTKGKKQSVINQETDAELERLDGAKQDVLTLDNTPTENSNNPVKSGGVYAADKALSDAIEAILLLIPSAASALNKLVDQATMNSSISTATATFRGTYNVVTDLELTVDATHEQIAAKLAQVVSEADNNDYAFVQVPVSAESTDIRRTERYKFNGTAWAYEYDLNTSGFTAAQWAAINSGITLALVAKLSGLPTSSELMALLGQKQDTLTFDNIPTYGSANPVKSGGVYSAINDEKTAREQLAQSVDGINGRLGNVEEVIPSGAAANNKLVANSSMEAYVTSIIDAITASFTIATSDGHINLTLTQTNGQVASLTLTSSDIASAQALTALTGRVSTAESDITTLSGRVSTNETDIANLQQLYNNLQQSQPVPVTSLPATGETGKIYRLAGTNSYTDYMYAEGALTTPIKMAEYDNAIDDEPTAGSDNLVKSGGLYGKVTQMNIGENYNEMPIGVISGSNRLDYNSSYRQVFIKVKDGDSISMTGPYLTDAVYAVIKKIPTNVNGAAIDFSEQTGFTSRLVLNRRAEVSFTVPSDGKYLCISTISNNVISIPSFLSVNGVEYRDLYETSYNNSVDIDAFMPISQKKKMVGVVKADGTINIDASYEQVVFRVHDGDIIEMIGPDIARETLISFIRTLPYDGGVNINLSTATGFTSRIVVNRFTKETYTVPSDVRFILLSTKMNNIDSTPNSFKINGYEYVSNRETVEIVENSINTNKGVYSSKVYKGIINGNGGYSYTTDFCYTYTVIEVNPYDIVQLSGDFDNSSTVYALLRTLPNYEHTYNADLSQVSGFTTRLVLLKDKTVSFAVPRDAHYLYIQKTVLGYNALPKVVRNNNSQSNIHKVLFDELIQRQGMLGSNGIWTGDETYKCVEIPVSPGDTILIQQNGLHDNVIGILTEPQTSIRPTGEVPFSNQEGFTSRIVVSPSEVKEFVVPSDGHFLVVSTLINNVEATPNSLYINGKDIINRNKVVTKTLEKLQSEVCVSDTIQYRGASAPMSVVNKNGIVFSAYLVGKMSEPTHFGERRDAVVMSMFPIMQPWRVEYFVVAENGVDIGDVHVVSPYEPNITLINGGVRCFVHIDNVYYYRDFNYATKTFGNLIPVTIDGQELSVDYLKSYLEDNDKDISEISWIIFTSNIIEHNGYKYGVITSNNSNPVIARSSDNFATLEFVSIVSNPSLFECAIGFIENTLYCTIRNGIGKYLYRSNDMETWEGMYIDASNVAMQKSNIISYNGVLYLIYSLWAHDSICHVWGGRNNIKIVRFNGTTFTDVDYLENPYGIVYPSIFEWNGIGYMIYSNSYLFRDQDNPVNPVPKPQGKDALFFVRLLQLI